MNRHRLEGLTGIRSRDAASFCLVFKLRGLEPRFQTSYGSSFLWSRSGSCSKNGRNKYRERILTMAKTLPAKGSSPDPLKTIAHALDTAVKAAKVGTADAKKAADQAFPAASRFLTRFVYTTSYTFSYGVVFPTIMIAKSIPANNAVVHGFVDGARAASEMVDQWKHRPLEAPAKPLASRSRSAKAKRKTAS